MWFKVENGPADEVEVKNAQNIKQLKQEIILQHPRMFGDDQEAGVWHLYKTEHAQEPEDSWNLLTVLDGAGDTGPIALLLRRVSLTVYGTSGQSSKRRKKTEWKNETQLNAVSDDPGSQLFELDSSYLADSGLPSKKLILYCHTTFHQQFAFLREESLIKVFLVGF